jgi:hypothetical protein
MFGFTAALTASQLEALGRVDVASASLEEQLDMVIYQMARLTRETFDVLVKERKLHDKMIMVRQLGLKKLRSADRQKEFKALMRRITTSNSQRNLVVHGNWQPDAGWSLEHEFEPPRAEVRAGDRHFKAEKLSDLAEQMAQESEDLYEFWRRNWVIPAIRRHQHKRPSNLLNAR